MVDTAHTATREMAASLRICVPGLVMCIVLWLLVEIVMLGKPGDSGQWL